MKTLDDRIDLPSYERCSGAVPSAEGSLSAVGAALQQACRVCYDEFVILLQECLDWRRPLGEICFGLWPA